MRKLLKNIMPTQWQHYYRKWRYSIPDDAPAELRLQEKFTTIFETTTGKVSKAFRAEDQNWSKPKP